MAGSALRGTIPPPPAAVHFMGIGGIGVSGLARILLEKGYQVSGCDTVPSRLTDELAQLGAAIQTGHDPLHLDGVDLVVYSSAVRSDNQELAAALARNVAVVKRGELLGRMLETQRTIAVAGTHGKTTTSALIATMLLDAGLDPTAFVGGEVRGLGVGGSACNARAGRGPWAVAEADEYDASFLRLAPSVAVLTNVEADHLDFYRDVAGVERAFAAFIASLRPDGAIVACADDSPTMRLVKNAPCRVVTYGVDTSANWMAHDMVLGTHGAQFKLVAPGVDCDLVVTSQMSGRYNVANTLAALAVAAEAGIQPNVAVASVARFRPPRRRQEIKGLAAGGALVLDDYAHHHTEIRATLAGLRIRFPDRRLRVAFQPHTYSRTSAFLNDIGASFGDADEVAVAEIYAARETNTAGVTGRDVVAAALSAGKSAAFTPTLDDVVAWFGRDDGPDCVLITMGAGDIWKTGERVVAGSSEREIG